MPAGASSAYLCLLMAKWLSVVGWHLYVLCPFYVVSGWTKQERMQGTVSRALEI